MCWISSVCSFSSTLCTPPSCPGRLGGWEADLCGSGASLITDFLLLLLKGSTCRRWRVRVRRVNSGHILPQISLFCVHFSWTSPLCGEFSLLISLSQLVTTPSGEVCVLPRYSLLSTAPSCIASLYSVHISVNSPFSKHLPKDSIWVIFICFLLRPCLTDKLIWQTYASLRECKRNSLPVGNENRLIEA